MKKTLITLLLIVSLAVLTLTGCNLTTDNEETLMKTSASVVTLDVNPSVRVYLASDDTVVEVEAVTEDGEDLILESIEDDDEFDKVEEYFNDLFFSEVDYDD